MALFSQLENRGVITIAGQDRASYLQGLVSNDVSISDSGAAVWAALLTPQGKFRHDFFLFKPGMESDLLALECEGAERLMDLGQTLRRYVLRADVQLGIASDLSCFVAWGDDAASGLGIKDNFCIPFAGGTAFQDPRLPEMGVRILAPGDQVRTALPGSGYEEAEISAWDAHRVRLGIPDGSRDMQPDKAILLENGFDELHGIDWQKGCYMGQELTARTKYRGLVKKRLLPVHIEGEIPEEGTAIHQDGRQVGTLYSIAGDHALALLRLDALKKETPLETGGALLTPVIPDWVLFPE